MTDIITAVENDVEKSVIWIEAAASSVWQAIGPVILFDILSILEMEAEALMSAGVSKLTGDHVGTLATNMLNSAEAQGKNDVVNLAPELMQAVLSTFVAHKSL